MISIKKTSALLLAGAVIAGSTGVQAISLEMPSRATVAGAVAVAAVGALYTRKSEKNFTPRYSVHKTRNITRALSSDYWKNIWYLFYDGVIGQRKQSSAVKVKEDGKVYASEDTPAYGFLGTVDSYVSPAVDAAKSYLFGFALFRAATDPNFSLGNLVQVFAKKGASTPAPTPGA